MKRLLCIVLLFAAVAAASAQTSIKVEVPNVVAMDEQFGVTFIVDGEKTPQDMSWSCGDSFQLVWGPQKGTTTSIEIINGKRTSSHKTTFYYILRPLKPGTFQLPAASATVDGERITSSPVSVQVVTDGAASASQSQGNGGGGQQEPSSSSRGKEAASSADASEVFMRLSLNKSDVVIGEPVTATLKLYTRGDIAGFENVKFPSFNGFWSQETYSPTNIEFKRESLGDKIYNSAVLRSYVLIPQQAGTLSIDPAEMVCLVNVRVPGTSSGSIFDSFFQDEYRTMRKRVSTSSAKVRVSALPAGQPASFGGGVGSFGISSRLSSQDLKTNEAASMTVTVSGRGNVSLLEEPKVSFPPDFEVYDTKVTENTDKSTGRTSGSKSFEFPFIPRSAGEFTIEPVEYSYYDVSAGKYVTLRTEPVHVKVAKGKSSGGASPSSVVTPGVERKEVKNLSDDIRYISSKAGKLSDKGSFFVGSPLFLALLGLLVAAALAAYFIFRKAAAMKADVAGSKNRKATAMARKRLRLAEDFLGKDLYTAYYEELHKALLGYVSDKLNMDMTQMSKENIAAALTAGGVDSLTAEAFNSLLDECEFARYSPDSGNEVMKGHFDKAVDVISSIDSALKAGSRRKGRNAGLLAVFLFLGVAFNVSAQDGAPSVTLTVGDTLSAVPSASRDTSVSAPQAGTLDPEILWERGIEAYSEGNFALASECWLSIVESGKESPSLYYNIGNAFFRLGNYPKAILHYEKALKLDPSYSDARNNLEFSQGFVQDRIEPVPEFILKSLARKLCYRAGSGTWAVAFLVLLAIALAMALLFALGSTSARRRTGFFTGLAALVLSLCALGFSLWQKSDYVNSDGAIVMSPVASVKASPSDNAAKSLFLIHEGTKVKILDEVGQWKNISLADGRQGWVESKDLEKI